MFLLIFIIKTNYQYEVSIVIFILDLCIFVNVLKLNRNIDYLLIYFIFYFINNTIFPNKDK